MKTFEGGERLGLPGHFFRFAAGVCLGATAVGTIRAIRAEREAGYEMWPSTEAEFINLPADAQEAVITFPGLGSVEGEAYAKCIKAMFEGPSAYLQHSTDGVNLQGIARKLIMTAPGMKRMHGNGHSMGGRHLLEVAMHAYKMKMDIDKSKLELGRLVYHCTPYEWDDIRNKMTAGLVLGMDAVGWQGGPHSKKVVSTVKRRLDGESWELAKEKAALDAQGGCSPRTYPKMLRNFRQLPRPHENLGLYAPLVGDETEAVYLLPDDSENDRTVKTDQACEKYAKFFKKLGVPFRALEVPGMGHADVASGCTHLASSHNW